MDMLKNITKEPPSTDQHGTGLLELLAILPTLIQEMKKETGEQLTTEQPPPLLDGIQFFLLLKHACEKGEETIWTEWPDICKREFSLSYDNAKCH